MISGKIDGSTTVTEPSASQIDDRWFGAVQTGFYDFSMFRNADSALGITTIRWPGGHLSETQPAVYGLDVPGLFDATELWNYNPDRVRPDLASSLAYARSNNAEFSMIIPTARYAHDVDLGEAHLRAFLRDLLSGHYGELPKHLTLEIGNEYKAQENFQDDASLYGLVASRFTEIISEELSAFGASIDRDNFSISVQMGFNKIDNEDIISEFSGVALENIDSVIFHALPISLQNLTRPNADEGGMTRVEQIDDYYKNWAEAVSDYSSAELELFMSAWTVGGSRNSPDGVDLQWHDYGLRGASTVLEIFAAFSSIGTDAAAVWGIAAGNLNSLYFEEGGIQDISHTGTIFGWLSESLPGMTYLGDYSAASRNDDFVNYNFGDGDKIASYIVANNADGGAHVTFSLDSITNFSLMSARRLSTNVDGDFVGLLDDPEARINEVVLVDEATYNFSESGIGIEYVIDFEIVELLLEVGVGTLGTSNEDWISGSSSSDEIIGLGANDFLQGLSGDDSISGGDGDDTILGGDGNDYLHGNAGFDDIRGGAGDDVIWGGTGWDILEGGLGADTFMFESPAPSAFITDFEVGVDVLNLAGVLADASGISMRLNDDYYYYGDAESPGTGDYHISITSDFSGSYIGIYNVDSKLVGNVTLGWVNEEEANSGLLSSLDFGLEFGFGL